MVTWRYQNADKYRMVTPFYIYEKVFLFYLLSIVTICVKANPIDENSLLGTTWVVIENNELIDYIEDDRNNGLSNTLFNTCNLQKIEFRETFQATSDSRFWSIGSMYSLDKNNSYVEKCWIMDYFISNADNSYSVLHIITKSEWFSHFVNMRFKIIDYSDDTLILGLFYKDLTLTYKKLNPGSAVNNIMKDEKKSLMYDLNGRQVQMPVKGVTIIKSNKSSEKKVIK